MLIVDEMQEHMRKVPNTRIIRLKQLNANNIEYTCGCRLSYVGSIQGDVLINRVTSLKLCDKHKKVRKQEA
jgi:hypothetical protein